MKGITNETKSRIFAQYLGINFSTSIDGCNGPYKLFSVSNENDSVRLNREPYHPFLKEGYSVNDCTLLIKPISKISDEDAIEVGKIELGADVLLIRKEKTHLNDNCIIVFGEGTGEVNIGESWEKSYYDNCQDKYDGHEIHDLNIRVYQYLQSKGYALPYMEYSVDDLVELGVYKLID